MRPSVSRANTTSDFRESPAGKLTLPAASVTSGFGSAWSSAESRYSYTHTVAFATGLPSVVTVRTTTGGSSAQAFVNRRRVATMQ
jgi:hypothetical protein